MRDPAVGVSDGGREAEVEEVVAPRIVQSTAAEAAAVAARRWRRGPPRAGRALSLASHLP